VRRFSRAAALCTALAAATALGFDRFDGDADVIADDLEIAVLQRELLSIDARGGGQRVAALERGERVLWSGARGRVGVVLTDRRALAVSTESAAWQATRFRRTESVPERALLGGRVALFSTRVRVIGFDGRTGNLVESALGPNEELLSGVVGQNVAVAVSDRRAFGLSPFAGGFFVADIALGERIDEVRAVANTATVVTSRRLLVFRAPSGTWEERRLDLR
jgi:hypothetical protein